MQILDSLENSQLGISNIEGESNHRKKLQLCILPLHNSFNSGINLLLYLNFQLHILIEAIEGFFLLLLLYKRFILTMPGFEESNQS